MSEPSIPQDRSPRSPSAPLAESIALTAKLFDAIRTATVGSEIAVKPLGYGGTNGAAMTTLATLAQYGLVDRTGGKVAVTPLAIRILHPKSDEQKEQAIREAALSPRVMKELHDGYLDCAEGVISGHLIQSGFNADKAKRVAAIHVANKEFAKLAKSEAPIETDDVSRVTDDHPNAPLTSAPTAIASQKQVQPTPAPIIQFPQKTTATVLAQYIIPLGSNRAMLEFTGHELTVEDFDALIDFVEFSKRQFQRASKADKHAHTISAVRELFNPGPQKFPRDAVWKNKDHDMPVTITGIAGEKDGVTYFQSSTGTGIPAGELEFKPSTNLDDY